ncbi:hypothetical protein CHS0354_034523 [Potamilus streckersoni]|uniref:Uncharacterized protein n=1 Tax=Potamilus streckersoni TaxID=2493646 RepID=A0AAE0SFT3_9BIVA|nr:hypothetical protein CHS0354_034523 [Potamilus streckersoni]
MGRGMYALTNRPNKFIANSRIGAPKNLNGLETRDNEKQSSVGMSSPKPVFNGRKFIPNRQSSVPQEPVSPQHEEIVRYLSEAWNKVTYELDASARHQQEAGPVVYREKQPNPILKDFKPFDLEDFWGKRILHKLTNCRPDDGSV